MRSGTAFILVVLALLMSGPAGAADPPADDPAGLVRQAIAASPDIASLESSIRAMSAATEAAVKWPDPMFAVEYNNVPWNSWRLGDSPMSGVQFRLQQTFPFPGKNARRQAAARQQTVATRLQLEDRRDHLAGMIESAYWRLGLARRLRAITVDHIRLLDQLYQAATARYQSGGGGQHNLLRLEVLKGALQEDIRDFDRREADLLAAINTARHVAPDTPITVESMAYPAPTPASAAKLTAEAAQKQPMVAALRARSKASRLGAESRSWERWPDITLWLGYRVRTAAGTDPGTDFMSVGFSIPLPFDYSGQTDAARREYLARADALHSRAQAAMDDITYRIRAALLAWNRSLQQAENYADHLIPKARESLDAALAAFSAGRTDFTALYEAQLQVLTFERTLENAVADTWLRRSEIATLTGIDPDVSAGKGVAP